MVNDTDISGIIQSLVDYSNDARYKVQSNCTLYSIFCRMYDRFRYWMLKIIEKQFLSRFIFASNENFATIVQYLIII